LSLFSCNDLNLKDNIIKLAKIGVDSFKIEGRMKDPEYTFNTVKNYRNILDRIIEKPEDFLNNLAFNNNLDENKSKNFENNNKNILLSFSRIPTNGYLNNQNGEKLINPFFPFHIGTELGVIKDFNKNFILVKLDEDISQRDGILILVKIKDKIMSFPFSAVKIMVNDREVYKGYKAQVVKISSPSLIEFFNIFNSKYGKQKLDKVCFLIISILMNST
jgi:Collagenase and related proteases